jgi:plastocyanin
MKGSTTGWTIAGAVAAGSLLLFGGMIVAMSVAGNMDGHMGMRRGGSDQTPVIATGDAATVNIRDFEYVPRDITIERGAAVTWTNEDGAPHTATDDNDAWDTDRLDEDESATVTFESSGEYGYYCVYHTYMKGTVTVR